MNFIGNIIPTLLTCTLLLVVPAFAADETITLALGGKFCDLYPDAVKSALKSVPGVANVDLKSKKGHAVVTGEAGKMKADQLVQAVNDVKGDGWECKAEVKK